MLSMQRERGCARENVHVMSLPAEQVNVKCRVSLAVLGHRSNLNSLEIAHRIPECMYI